MFRSCIEVRPTEDIEDNQCLIPLHMASLRQMLILVDEIAFCRYHTPFRKRRLILS